MLPRRKWLFFTVGVVAAGVLAWKAFVYHHHLRFIPEAMGVWWVRYAVEESWGCGPGGDEAGIVVYDMPDRVREALKENGLAWLETLPPNSWQTSHGYYDTWRNTPVPSTHRWADPAVCPPITSDWYRLTYPYGCPGITGYMGGFGRLPFDREVEEMVNEALFSPGAYYAFGRWGLLVLIPARERIVYVY